MVNTEKLSLSFKVGLFFLLVVIFFPQNSEASVLYNSPYVGETVRVSPASASTTSFYVYLPSINAPSSWPSFPLSASSPYVFYTTTGNETTVRVKPQSGVTCSTVNNFSFIDITGNAVSIGSGVANGDYCDFTFSTTAGKNLIGLSFCLNGGCTGDAYLQGNTYNTGHSYNGFNQLKASGGYAFSICSSNSCDPFIDLQNGGLTPPNTKFVYQKLTMTTPYIAKFKVGYLIDSSHLDTEIVAKNPQIVSVCISQQPAVSFGCRGEFITLPWVDGYATTTIDYQVDSAGVYDVLIKFSNGQSLITGEQVLAYTYINGQFTVDSTGAITNQEWDAPYVGNQYDLIQTPYQTCLSVNGYWATVVCEIVTYLFIPEEGITGTLLSAFSYEQFPAIRSAFEVYAFRAGAIADTSLSTSSAYILELTVPTTTGATVPSLKIFAIEDIFGHLPAETKAIVRGILLFGVILMFGLMIRNTIDNVISLRYTDRKN